MAVSDSWWKSVTDGSTSKLTFPLLELAFHKIDCENFKQGRLCELCLTLALNEHNSQVCR